MRERDQVVRERDQVVRERDVGREGGAPDSQH